MKKVLAIAVTCVFALSSFVTAAGTDKAVNQASAKEITKQMAIVEKLEAKSGKDFGISWNSKSDNPSLVRGNLSDKAVKSSDEAAQYLKDNKDLFKLNGGDFKVEKVNKDELGMTHYKTVYTIDGIPVFGGEVIVHTDKNGNVKAVNTSIDSDIPVKAWKSEVKLSEGQAIKVAEATLGYTANYIEAPSTEMYLYNAKGEWQPVYVVTLHYYEPSVAKMKIYVNAITGDIVNSYNDIQFETTAAKGTGIDVMGNTRALDLAFEDGKYYLYDMSHGAGAPLIVTYDCHNTENYPGTDIVNNTTNTFNRDSDKAGVSAQYWSDKAYHFYKDNFNRNGADNVGSAIISCVHYGDKYNNAFSDGSVQAYGDGDGLEYRAFSASGDVIGHEMTHTVIANECDLVYQDQSGALNESLADVFGYIIEGDVNDWYVAEDICLQANGFRSMSNPNEFGDPASMAEYMVMTDDNGGVHWNNGIMNKAFYNIATQVNDNTKMANIYYRAICNYLTSTSDFEVAKTLFVQCARDLYGDAIAQMVENGYNQVGLAGPSVDNYEVNDTIAQAYPVESGKTYCAYLYKSTDVDYYKFTTTGAGAISMTMTNLPADYDLYLLDSNGNIINRAERSGNVDENITNSCTGASTFYVKVVGYNKAWSLAGKYSLKITYPYNDPNIQWTTESASIDSPHDYTNNYNGTNTYTKAGATKVAVHFTRCETERGYDYVNIKDKNGNTVASYNGMLSDFWAQVDGDTININLTTDGSVVYYGYHIDQVRYTMQ